MSIYKSLLLALSLALLEGCMGWGSTSRIEPFVVSVVDAETGEPLEGVIMLAKWRLIRKSFLGDVYVGEALIQEFVSNSNGDVGLSEPKLISISSGESISPRGIPTFSLYSEGYKNHAYTNVSRGDGSRSSSQFVGDFNGKQIYLEKGGDVTLQRPHSFHTMVLDANRYAEENSKCPWELFPYSNISRVISKQENPDTNYLKSLYSKSDYCLNFEVFRERYML